MFLEMLQCLHLLTELQLLADFRPMIIFLCRLLADGVRRLRRLASNGRYAVYVIDLAYVHHFNRSLHRHPLSTEGRCCFQVQLTYTYSSTKIVSKLFSAALRC